MNNFICSAIHSRAIVEFQYDGGLRVVEPHCHGTSTAGNEMIRAYQVDGYSRSGDASGWRLYQVAKIRNWIETERTFRVNRPDYNPDDEAMDHVHCCV